MKLAMTLILTLFALNSWSFCGEGPMPVPALVSGYVASERWTETEAPVSHVFWYRDSQELSVFSEGVPVGTEKALTSAYAPIAERNALYLFQEKGFLPIPENYEPLTVVDYQARSFRGFKKSDLGRKISYQPYDFQYNGGKMFFEESPCQTPSIEGLKPAIAESNDYFFSSQDSSIYQLTPRCEWRREASVPMVGGQVISVRYLGGEKMILELEEKHVYVDESGWQIFGGHTGPIYLIDAERGAWLANNLQGGVSLIVPGSIGRVPLFAMAQIESPDQVTYSVKDQVLYLAGKVHPQAPNGVHAIGIDYSGNGCGRN